MGSENADDSKHGQRLAKSKVRVREFVRQGEFDKARQFLERLAAGRGSEGRKVAVWARRMLQGLGEERRRAQRQVAILLETAEDFLQKHDHPQVMHLVKHIPPPLLTREMARVLARMAQQCMVRHDYRCAAWLLERIPARLWNERWDSLWDRSRTLADEVASLEKTIEENRGGSEEVLMAAVERLLTLQPHNRMAQELYDRTARIRRALRRAWNPPQETARLDLSLTGICAGIRDAVQEDLPFLIVGGVAGLFTGVLAGVLVGESPSPQFLVFMGLLGCVAGVFGTGLWEDFPEIGWFVRIVCVELLVLMTFGGVGTYVLVRELDVLTTSDKESEWQQFVRDRLHIRSGGLATPPTERMLSVVAFFTGGIGFAFGAFVLSLSLQLAQQLLGLTGRGKQKTLVRMQRRSGLSPPVTPNAQRCLFLAILNNRA